MKISVEPHKCIGAGQCVSAAPAVFDQNEDDGIVILLDEIPPQEQHSAARSAARLCPALAIHIDDE
jgi:ferredoxin